MAQTATTWASLLILAMAALANLSCEAAPEYDVALDNALQVHLVDGKEIEDVRAHSGNARNADLLDPTGIFLIESPAEYDRIWTQHADGRAPVINWSRDTVIGIFLSQSEVTGLKLHNVMRGIDGTIYVNVLGDTTPLTTPRYNFPFCILAIPTRERPIDVRVFYVRKLPTGGVEIHLRGNRERFSNAESAGE